MIKALAIAVLCSLSYVMTGLALAQAPWYAVPQVGPYEPNVPPFELYEGRSAYWMLGPGNFPGGYAGYPTDEAVNRYPGQ
jgi:hypothetical protein